MAIQTLSQTELTQVSGGASTLPGLVGLVTDVFDSKLVHGLLVAGVAALASPVVQKTLTPVGKLVDGILGALHISV